MNLKRNEVGYIYIGITRGKNQRKFIPHKLVNIVSKKIITWITNCRYKKINLTGWLTL